MKKIIATTFIIPALFMFFNLATPVNAQEYDGDYTVDSVSDSGNDSRMLNRLKSIAQRGGYAVDTESTSVANIVGVVIDAILSLIGLIFIILTIYSGINWMTSQGNEEKISKSKKTLQSSIIGLIVALSAWSIWNFIFVRLIL